MRVQWFEMDRDSSTNSYIQLLGLLGLVGLVGLLGLLYFILSTLGLGAWLPFSTAAADACPTSSISF